VSRESVRISQTNRRLGESACIVRVAGIGAV
jgi:hypothetical protein